VSSHIPTVPSAESPFFKNDTANEKRFLHHHVALSRREILARDARICASFKAETDRFLFDFSVSERDGGFPPAGLVEIALAELERLQGVLAEHATIRPDEPLDLENAIDWRNRRHWCHLAVRHAAGAKAAKTCEIEAARELGFDAPITVCMGSIKRGYIGAPAVIPVIGCLRVFADTTRRTGVMWTKWCPDDALENSQRARSQWDAHVARWPSP
jgi:hypothetical protein